MTYRLFGLALIAMAQAALPRPATAKGISFTCPIKYPASSVHFADSPAEWTPILRSELRLNAAGVMEGPVEQRGILKPERRAVHRGFEETYIGLVGDATYQKWLWCGYGVGNDVLLVMPLDSKISRCTVTYARDTISADHNVGQIRCR